jgi:predicted RNA-binding protein with RPS1 domain
VANNVLFFERNIVDIEQYLDVNSNLVQKFIDLDKDNKVDQEIKGLLDNVKHKKIPGALPASNIFKFDVIYYKLFIIEFWLN